MSACEIVDYNQVVQLTNATIDRVKFKKKTLVTVFIPLATDRTPQLLRDCSVRWLLLHVVTDAPVRQTITHCNGVTSWTVLLFGALRKHSCITCPRDLNAQRKQTSQTQAVILTCFSSVQLISITAIGCSVFSTIWICLGRQSEHLEQHVTFFWFYALGVLAVS